ncbi:hypothetical protein [Streptomyces sp. D54]|uniref:hypothetical protein n=1 Tax=Streptomyces sp. D54 TaxID=1290289 RepID=UPI003CF6D32C
MVRARWTRALKGSDRLHTAYSLEPVVDEPIFVMGPALSVALCTALFPEAGPLVAGPPGRPVGHARTPGEQTYGRPFAGRGR